MSITISYKIHNEWCSITVFNKGYAASVISSLRKRGATAIGLEHSKGSDIGELKEVIEQMSMNETLELIQAFKDYIATLA